MFGRGWVVERSHDAKSQFHLNGARILPGDLKFKCFAEGLAKGLQVHEFWPMFDDFRGLGFFLGYCFLYVHHEMFV